MFVWEEWAGKEGLRLSGKCFLLHFRLSFLIVKRLLTLLTCFYMSPIHHCRAMMQRGAEGPKAINMNSCRKVMWIRFLKGKKRQRFRGVHLIELI